MIIKCNHGVDPIPTENPNIYKNKDIAENHFPKFVAESLAAFEIQIPVPIPNIPKNVIGKTRSIIHRLPQLKIINNIYDFNTCQ